MQNTLGIYIGRFQPFHNGHKSVVEQMLSDNNQKNIIILGSLEQDTERNIYSSEWRKQAIQKVFPQIDIQTLADNPDDKDWVLGLRKLLDTYKAETYIFYCGDRKNDYAIQVIEGHADIFEHKHIEIREISRTIFPISGTQVRETMKNEGKESIKNDVPKEVFEKIQKDK